MEKFGEKQLKLIQEGYEEKQVEIKQDLELYLSQKFEGVAKKVQNVEQNVQKMEEKVDTVLNLLQMLVQKRTVMEQ